MAKTRLSKSPKKDKHLVAQEILSWYDCNARDLPWRRHEGRGDTPYHTWLSEIMLQQTTVTTVIPYYMHFIERWPHVTDLAEAQDDDVMQAWAGLGYYSRARNLLKCARMIVSEHNGQFPDTIDALKSLPGIGDYTANAIRAIAFDKPANVVDGNIERVTARLFAFDKPINLPAHKKELKDLAASMTPQKRHGDYAQALMDLGATICTPRNPQCALCPLQKMCLAHAKGCADTLPVIERIKKQAERTASFYIVYDDQKRILLYKRPAKGLLGGLWAFPGSAWDQKADTQVGKKPRSKKGKNITHVFSHFKLSATVSVVSHTQFLYDIPNDAAWFAIQDLPALPTLMAKVWEAGRSDLVSSLSSEE